MNIEELRKRIDEVDRQLVSLLNERTRLAVAIGKIKHKAGDEIYSPHREEAVLRRVVASSEGPLPQASLRAIWREVMSASLALEKDLIIAYVAPEGSASHSAARNKFGTSLNYMSEPDLRGVLEAVLKGRADYGVVPTEHLRASGVVHTCDFLVTVDLRICAEIRQPTRHFVVGRQAAARTGSDKTAVVFALPDRIGALEEGLASFRKHRVNLVNIESRPIQGEPGAIYFFVELWGHATDAPVERAIAELGRHSRFVKVLGSYASQSG